MKPADKRQERFLQHVAELNLEFPTKELSEKTGYATSTISEYLNNKVNVSRNFYEIFLECYGLTDDNTNPPTASPTPKGKTTDKPKSLYSKIRDTVMDHLRHLTLEGMKEDLELAAEVTKLLEEKEKAEKKPE